MVSPSIPNGIYPFIKISPNKLPMLSNKVHCDPKKQRDPKMQSNTKSSAIQKAEQYKKQRDPKSSAIKWIINSVQRKKAARHQIALSTKKSNATHQSNYIQSTPHHHITNQLHSIANPPPSAPYSSPVRFTLCPYYHPHHPSSPLKLIISSPSLPYIYCYSFSPLINPFQLIRLQ